MTSKEIRCSTIINATQSWDRVKSKSDNAVTGELILARSVRLFIDVS